MIPVQYDQMIVRPACLEYTSALITQYFAAGEPSVITRPVWWGEHTLIQFAARQFKALSAEGIEIDEVRLNNFLPTEFNFRLADITLTPYGLHDMSIRAYMDIQGFPERPSEVAVIFAIGNSVIKIYHSFQSVRRPFYTERMKCIHGHGLKWRPGTAITREALSDDLRDLMLFYNPMEIISDSLDVAEMLPVYKDRVRILK